MIPNVFVIGDSISMHYGPWLESFLGGAFSYGRKTGTSTDMENLDVPSGGNGGDSARVLRYLETNHVHGEIPNADFLLVNCGLHDLRVDPGTGQHQVEIATYRENLARIVQAGLQLSSQLIWVTTTPCNDTVHNTRNKEFHRYRSDLIVYNEVADEIMDHYGVSRVDLFAFTEFLETQLGEAVYEDHVHFIPEIRRLQGAFIAGFLWGCAGRDRSQNDARESR